MGGGGHHHHGGGGGFSRGGYYGGYYPYPTYYSEPNYVPVFIVPDEDDLERERKKKKKQKEDAVHGLGIFTPPNKLARPLGAGVMGLGVVFGNTTSDSKVTETQKWLNGYLSQLGFSLLTVDGKLGAKTCGACAWAFGNTPAVDISTAPASFFEVWQVCSTSSQTAPTPLTTAAKTSDYTTAVTTLQKASYDSSIVKSAQSKLNAGLTAHGMCAIAVDGKPGPATCGAQVWLIANAGGDGLTQTERDNLYPTCSVGDKVAPNLCAATTTAPVAVATPTVTPVIAPAPSPVVVAPAPKVNAAGMAMGLGLMAALGAAVYYFKHKAIGG
jgi:peptidoglycan hydrolase-like protein with peptidoglycan-binding domain